jgi:hypothetical protein
LRVEPNSGDQLVKVDANFDSLKTNLDFLIGKTMLPE